MHAAVSVSLPPTLNTAPPPQTLREKNNTPYPLGGGRTGDSGYNSGTRF